MNEDWFYICPGCGCVVLKAYAARHVDFHAGLALMEEAIRQAKKLIQIAETGARVEIDMEPVDWKDRPAR